MITLNWNFSKALSGDDGQDLTKKLLRRTSLGAETKSQEILYS